MTSVLITLDYLNSSLCYNIAFVPVPTCDVEFRAVVADV